MTEIRRDRHGKPYIIPPDGGPARPYYRASNFGKVLENQKFLELWKIRMAVKGVASHRELTVAAMATPLSDKSGLNSIAQRGIDAAGGSERSTLGTALHSFTEMLDRSEPIPFIPAEHAADFNAYREATARWDMIHIEQFVVCDAVEAAGTPDRLMLDVGSAPHLEQRDGHAPEMVHDPLIVGDLKTNGNAHYLDAYAVQLAVYAHSVLYDPATGERTPVAIDQQVGWLFHMPAGEGRCDLYEVDLAAGWEGALLAADVRKWRKRRGLARPLAELVAA